MTTQTAENRKRAFGLLGGLGLAVAVVTALVFLAAGLGIIGLVLAVLLAGAAVAALFSQIDVIALKRTGARPVNDSEFAPLHNLVEGLSLSAGVVKPRLYVVDDDAANICAIGRDANHANLVVTTGLLDTLNRIELEGVLAHELSHVQNLDILPGTLAVTLVSPFGSKRLAAFLPPHREEFADLAAVGLTRYPPGLIAALEKIAAQQDQALGVHPSTAHLWLVEPVASPAPEAVASNVGPMQLTRVPLTQRIDRLREL